MKKFFYKVAKGDSVLGLGNRFSVPHQSLIIKNNLAREINEGDVLYLEQTNGYKISPLEDYESVSKKLNLSVEYLRSQNPNFNYVFYGLIIKI